MKVIAISPGYDNKTVRQPDEVFDMPDGSKGTWFKPAEGDTKGPVKATKNGGQPAATPESLA